MIPPADHERETLPPSAETHIPKAGKLPSFTQATDRVDPVASLAERVGDLSDALHSEEGPVHRLIAGLAKAGAKRELRDQKRHRQLVRLLTHLTNEVASLNQTVAKLVPEQKRHAAILELVERRNGAAE